MGPLRPFPMASICPQLLTNGTCSDTSCTCVHDIQFCHLCGVKITSPAIRSAHFNGKQHRRRLRGEQLLSCTICDRAIHSTSWTAHVSGQKHIRAARRKSVPASREAEPIVTDTSDQKYCDLCRMHVPERTWTIHVGGRLHKRLEGSSVYKAALAEAEREKNGITIEGSFDFDVVAPAVASSGTSLTSTIEMTIPQLKIKLVEVSLMSPPKSGHFLSPYVCCPIK